MIVAIQGEPGSFSHLAALQALGPTIELLPRRSFQALFAAVADGEAERGIVPIENTLAGSVHENYDRMRESGLHIVGETQVRVRLCLIVRPGTPLQAVQRVASHPVALKQIQGFLRESPGVQAVAVYDTAGSVADLMKGESDYEGAVASSLAAELHGGEVLLDGIEDNPRNFTRFWVISRQPAVEGIVSKTSVVFTLANVPGALHAALGAFARRHIDLSKIESRPIPGRPWEYRFYLDLRGEAGAGVAEAIEELGTLSTDLAVLGSYEEMAALPQEEDPMPSALPREDDGPPPAPPQVQAR
jgi:prephenate dehydratase